ncbi:MAG: hypothetical protein QOJ39_2246 [Candidatus Eremiobacteraeota bacterium]|jgi:hypothetical protein|nr:hypothetical protein [Candidatus Eremiobacteraeota bacterium]
MKGDFSRLSFQRDKHTAGVLHQQGRVWLDADWNEEVHTRLDLAEREAVDVIGRCGVPKPGTAFALAANPAAPADFLISTGPGALGRCYVDGILCELYEPSLKQTSYLHQPDSIDPPPIAMPPANDLTARNALVYVETWRRLITYLEDPDVREKALNGPDTATRLRTVVQVKAIDISPNVTTCAAALQLVTDGNGTLTTLPPVDDQPPDPCRIPDPGTYTGRENHLYRVEIHEGGGVVSGPVRKPAAAAARSFRVLGETAFTNGGGAPVKRARFKWSRNNAADAVQVLSVSQDRLTLTVQSLGRDLATALVDGNIVEICDDRSELGPARGHLTTIAGNPDPDRLTITLADPLPPEFVLPVADASALSPVSPMSPLSPPGALTNRHATLRRWDGVGFAAPAFDQQTTPDMDLGDGVHVQFGGTDLRPGDYWQFVARSVDGSVEKLTNARPTGIIRHRCALALVRWQWLRLFDVAAFFAALPGQGPNDLVDAMKERFAAAHVTKTDAVTLKDVARSVGVTDAELSGVDAIVAKLPATTELTFRVVQDCRSPFAPLTDGDDDIDAAMHVLRVGRLDKDANITQLRNDSVVTTADVANGIGVWFDRTVEPHTISRPTCYVEVEIPFAAASFQTTNSLTLDNATGLARRAALAAPAYQRITLAANLAAAGNSLTWRPRGGLPELDQFAALAPPEDRGLLARLHLRGNVIWSAGPDPLYLDGDAFGKLNPADPAQTLLRFPTGDGKRGGDFEMWFWLKAAPPRFGLYVVDRRNSAVEFYPLASDGPTAPTRRIQGANTLPRPLGVAVDGVGNVYVSDDAINAVLQFAPGAGINANPIARTLDKVVSMPSGIAVDAGGSVYVANSGQPGNGASIRPSVTVFAHNALGAAPVRTISGDATGLTNPFGIAAAPDGTIYVAVNSGSTGRVLVFAPGQVGNQVPTRQILPTSTPPFLLRGVALDAAGNFYVAGQTVAPAAVADAVFIFAPGSDHPARTITGFANTKLASPWGITVDDAGNVYVSNAANNTVTVYAPDAKGDAAPIRTIRGADSSALAAPAYITIGL